MPKSSDFVKTWLPGPSRGTQTFNSPGNKTIDYGRYLGTVSGRGGAGNAPTAIAWNTNWNTNYNVAYPVANRPAATWNTNYNVAYPIANQPIGTRPASTWSTNYNVAYPVANQPIANQPASAWSVNYNVTYPVANQPIANYNPPTNFFWNQYINIYNNTFGGVYTENRNGNLFFCPGPYQYTENDNVVNVNYQCQGSGNNPNWNTNYNVAYPEANRPVNAWNTNWNTNYNVAYPIANQPVNAWNTNWNTNYNVAYPIANQPAATWNTNYNVVYPIANQPIANQPVSTYAPGIPGVSTNVLGVTFPGGPIDLSGFGGSPGTAPFINETVISYYTYPDNATYPVVVPTGGQIIVKLE